MFIDTMIYTNSLRITSNDIDFIYNPLDMEIVPDNITKSDLKKIKIKNERDLLKCLK